MWFDLKIRPHKVSTSLGHLVTRFGDDVQRSFHDTVFTKK